jgi:hypothetical protein
MRGDKTPRDGDIPEHGIENRPIPPAFDGIDPHQMEIPSAWHINSSPLNEAWQQGRYCRIGSNRPAKS